MSYHLATSRACVVRCWVVGPPGAIHREWAAGRCYTVAACCEWTVERRCPVAILQTPNPHALLAFNVSLIACLTCVRYRPCHLASWKIRACPDERS
jgi:hypothetical protein